MAASDLYYLYEANQVVSYQIQCNLKWVLFKYGVHLEKCSFYHGVVSIKLIILKKNCLNIKILKGFMLKNLHISDDVLGNVGNIEDTNGFDGRILQNVVTFSTLLKIIYLKSFANLDLIK